MFMELDLCTDALEQDLSGSAKQANASQISESRSKMDESKMVSGKVKKPGKRGRKPAKIDLKAKLERSRQSARECRARKKLRYQYLEELVSSKERAICALREELEMWCIAMDQGKIPSEIKALLTGDDQKGSQSSSATKPAKNTKYNSSGLQSKST
ncbi:cAMP-responsive element-binding protein-like 2 [Silurus meridionalis]|nr:cAMP-responsive element-binding protein-like 2 [Silurus meridionalis]